MDRNSPSSKQPGTAEKHQLFNSRLGAKGAEGDPKPQMFNPGFVLEVDGTDAPLPCKLVQGFDEALEAAKDPRLSMPLRLVITNPDLVTFEWLASWSEDDEQVRRTIRIQRRSDAQTVIAVVTLAAFGHAIPTALTIESLTLPSQRQRIVRSGVHPKSFLNAIRAHYERTLPQPSLNDVDAFPPDVPTDDSA